MADKPSEGLWLWFPENGSRPPKQTQGVRLRKPGLEEHLCLTKKNALQKLFVYFIVLFQELSSTKK